jgi:hypothetical protein
MYYSQPVIHKTVNEDAIYKAIGGINQRVHDIEQFIKTLKITIDVKRQVEENSSK